VPSPLVCWRPPAWHSVALHQRERLRPRSRLRFPPTTGRTVPAQVATDLTAAGPNAARAPKATVAPAQVATDLTAARAPAATVDGPNAAHAPKAGLAPRPV